jgi:aminopeptidase-like protein
MKQEISELDELLSMLFPICRSLTGDGNRETFRILQEVAPIGIIEYPSGAPIYDWEIPDEWNIHDAFIKDKLGNRLVDFRKSNLHVMGYSEPIHQWMTFAEIEPHLHCLESAPDAIPYRTSYYQRDWGFCVTKAQYDDLKSYRDRFEIKIDSEFDKNGSMTVGEIVVQGELPTEYLVSTYCCHPSMANDNLSGLLTALFLARDCLSGSKPKYSWRFIFVPETIGALAYLSHNENALKMVKGGLVITTCGGPGRLGYKESFLKEHLVDRATRLAFRDQGRDPVHYPFVPDGSDERQYSSPAFRIPTITITKDKYYEYPDYHTSCDNLDFVNGAQIFESLSLYRHVIKILDENTTYLSNFPNGEPQLGRRGLYPTTGGAINQPAMDSLCSDASDIDAIMWIMFFSDGKHDLLEIAEKSGISADRVLEAGNKLESAGLVRSVHL